MTQQSPSSDSNALSYMARIRNPKKREYAMRYWRFLRFDHHEPDWAGLGLSYMAGQAVRMELGRLAEQAQ